MTVIIMVITILSSKFISNNLFTHGGYVTVILTLLILFVITCKMFKYRLLQV